MKYGNKLKYILSIGLICLAGCNSSNDTAKASKSMAQEGDFSALLGAQGYIPCHQIVAKVGLAKSFALCLQQANAGDPNAKAWVGTGYANGEGVSSDNLLAREWLTQAATTGDSQGLYQLGLFYLRGEDTEKNPKLAHDLLIRAANQQHVPAMVALGEFYQIQIVPANNEQAYYWYQQAIKHDDKTAQYKLAMMLLAKDIASQQDPLSLLISSAKAGFGPAQSLLGKIYQEGLFVEQNTGMAFKWYWAAAQQSDPQGCYEIGMAYLQGGLKQVKNPELGLKYLQQAAHEGYYPAQYALASLQAEGNQTLSSIYQAIEILRPEALSGSTQAQIKLAQALTSLYEPQYDLAAFHWLEKASQQDPEALYLLGTFYYDGIGTEINYPKAQELFSELALKNHPLAQYKLGQMYYYGQAVEQNIALAKDWLLKAAQSNVEEAKILIAILLKEDPSNFTENDQADPSREWVEFAASTGEPQALYLKGLHHLYGKQGFEQNIELGIRLISQAAEQNVVAAQRQLGEIYGQGLFGLEDENQAYDWAMMASKNGDPAAQLQLAHMFYTGIGAQVDFVQSYAWAQSAINLGKSDAQGLRDEVGKLMDATEIAQAKFLAKQYSQSHHAQDQQKLSYHD